MLREEFVRRYRLKVKMTESWKWRFSVLFQLWGAVRGEGRAAYCQTTKKRIASIPKLANDKETKM